MFLDSFGRPVIAMTKLSDDLLDAPVLISSNCELKKFHLLSNWTGCLYASTRVLHELLKSYDAQSSSFNVCELIPNVPIEVRTSDSGSTNVTLIPFTSANIDSIFLLKDQFTTRIVAESIPADCLSVFLNNPCLREAVMEGVDVLYLNDSIRESPQSTEEVETSNYRQVEEQRNMLVYLIRPKCVRNMSDMDLNSFSKYCQSYDLYDYKI